jgi:hypothetical protein
MNDESVMEITVNRRRFDRSDGVCGRMTAEGIATLIGIPAQNAIVEREIARDRFIPVIADDTLEIASGMHFLVTRKFVMGG